jgi:hypothetical protein
MADQDIMKMDMNSLLEAMLSGGVQGGKLTADKEGVSMKLPTDILTNMLSGEGDKIDLSGISDSDLAGLTPQDISSAIGLKMHQDELGRKKVSDIIDMMYKSEQLGASRIKSSIDLYKALKEDETAEMKNYNYAVKSGFKGSFMDFKDAARTTHQKDYDEAVRGGYKGSFNTWLLQMQRAGASNITNVIDTYKQKAQLEGYKYFMGKEWVDDVNKYLEGPGWAEASKYKDRSYGKNMAATNYIESKIEGAGGQIVDAKRQGNVGKWKVKWPSGDETVVTYSGFTEGKKK